MIGTTLNLTFANLTVGVFHLPPKIEVTFNTILNKIEVTGVLAEVIEIIAHSVGFSYNYRIFPIGEFGIQYEPNKWNGIVGALQKSEIDFEGITLIPNTDRLDVIDFTTSSLFSNYLAVVISAHKENTQTLTGKMFSSYFAPFQANMWLCLVILWLVVCLLTTVFYTETLTTIIKRTFCKALFLEDFFFTRYNKVQFSRIVIFTSYFIALLVVFSTYSSFLIASVAIKNKPKLFDDIDALLKEGSYKFGINKHTKDYSNIESGATEMYRKVKAIMDADPRSHIPDMDVGFDRAEKENFAFLVNSVDGAHAIRKRCALVFLPCKYFRAEFFISFPKHSPLREIFSQLVHRLRTSGVLEVILMRHLTLDRPSCNEVTKMNPLNLAQVTPIFIVYIIGLTGSGIIFVLERLFYLDLTYTTEKNKRFE